MIPHTAKPPLRTRKARLLPPPPRRGRSAELSCYESEDRSTGRFRFRKRFRLREYADHGLGSAGTDEHAAAPVQLLVEPIDLETDELRDLVSRHPHVRLDLGKALHLRGCRRERPALERAAEQQARGKPVAGHMVAQIDDVARLLPAEQAALAVERLQ